MFLEYLCFVDFNDVAPLILIFLFLIQVILHPIEFKNFTKSFISGSHAQILIMDLPSAKQAAMIIFSVAPTDILEKFVYQKLNYMIICW